MAQLENCERSCSLYVVACCSQPWVGQPLVAFFCKISAKNIISLVESEVQIRTHAVPKSVLAHFGRFPLLDPYQPPSPPPPSHLSQFVDNNQEASSLKMLSNLHFVSRLLVIVMFSTVF